MFGKKKTHESDHDHQAHVGKPATAKGRALLLMSILLGLLGVILLIIGAAMLQSRIHDEELETLRDVNSADNLTYKDAFQSAHYTPYSDSHSKQWQFVWFLMAASAFVFLLTALIAASAVRIVQWIPPLVGLHVYVLVYCTFGIDTFLWINHTRPVRDVFGKKRIAVTLAGLFIMAVAHGLCILSMGLIPSTRHIDNRYMQNHSSHERIVEKQVPVPVSAPRESHTHESHFERRETPTFTNNPAQPVRVHQGETVVRDSNPHDSEPVRVHMGNTTNTTGATELGARRY